MTIFFLQNHAENEARRLALSEKCPYSELLWSAFSRIWTAYGEILRISSYSVRVRESMDENNSEYGHVLRSEFLTSFWFFTASGLQLSFSIF